VVEPVLVQQVLRGAGVGGHVEIEPGLGVPDALDDLAQVLAGVAGIAALPVRLAHRDVADRTDARVPRHLAALDAGGPRVFLERPAGASARELDHAEVEVDEELAVARAAELEIVQRLTAVADRLVEMA